MTPNVLPPEMRELPPPSDALVRMLERAQHRANLMRALNAAYWLAILLTLGWFASMVIDRASPVRPISRELVHARVRPGEHVLIHGVRERLRQCEVTRRFVVVDGIGRRHNFEPEVFKALGPLGINDDAEGPVVPFDAAPGRGRVFGIYGYDCNLLQRALGWSIVVVSPPLEFEILPRGSP